MFSQVGATVNECARILKENGAKEILILSIAKQKDKILNGGTNGRISWKYIRLC